MSKLLTVSLSPHIHTDESVNKIMYRVILALVGFCFRDGCPPGDPDCCGCLCGR